jgi:hypothetical protein
MKLYFYFLIAFPLFLLTLQSCKPTAIKTYTLPKQTITVATIQRSHPVSWTAPTTWAPQPLTDFRKASYHIESAYMTDIGDVSIVSFPGKAGGLLANVNRWCTQLGLPAFESSSALSSIQSSHSHPQVSMSIIDLKSTSLVYGKRHKKRMIVGVFEATGDTYFIKIVGPEPLVSTAYPDFLTLLDSVIINEK